MTETMGKALRAGWWCLVCGALAACTPVTPLLRADEIEISTARVSYSDLNLSRSSDAAELRRRIRYAARQVCGPVDDLDPENTPRALRFKVCYEHAVKESFAAISAEKHVSKELTTSAAAGTHPD
jgi:UrcA family protein